MKNFLIYIPPFIEQDRPNLNNHWVILTLELLPQIIEKYNVTVVMGETQYKFLQKNTLASARVQNILSLHNIPAFIFSGQQQIGIGIVHKAL